MLFILIVRNYSFSHLTSNFEISGSNSSSILDNLSSLSLCRFNTAKTWFPCQSLPVRVVIFFAFRYFAIFRYPKPLSWSNLIKCVRWWTNSVREEPICQEWPKARWEEERDANKKSLLNFSRLFYSRFLILKKDSILNIIDWISVFYT